MIMAKILPVFSILNTFVMELKIGATISIKQYLTILKKRLIDESVQIHS